MNGQVIQLATQIARGPNLSKSVKRVSSQGGFKISREYTSKHTVHSISVYKLTLPLKQANKAQSVSLPLSSVVLYSSYASLSLKYQTFIGQTHSLFLSHFPYLSSHVRTYAGTCTLAAIETTVSRCMQLSLNT